MFQSFYQFRDQPFDANPDPRFLHLSKTHREAFSSLLYRIQIDSGFIAMVAQPGMGKTMLLFHLLNRLQSSAKTAFIFHTQCTSHELLRHLLSEFECDTSITDTVQMYQELKSFLLREANAGRRCVLIIDEAQNLQPDVLETIRLLSNFETPRRKLLQIVLSGQSELDQVLARPELRQLRQRLSCIIHIRKFSPEETALYIAHRLSVAGYAGQLSELFSVRALTRIAQLSDGIPRVINNICFNALSLGFALEFPKINTDIVDEVANDLGLSNGFHVSSSNDFPYPGAGTKWDEDSEAYASIAAVCGNQAQERAEAAAEATPVAVAEEPPPPEHTEGQPEEQPAVAQEACDDNSDALEAILVPVSTIEAQSQPERTPYWPASTSEEDRAEYPAPVFKAAPTRLSNVFRNINGQFFLKCCASVLVLCIAPAVNNRAPDTLSVQAAMTSVRQSRPLEAGSAWLAAPPLVPVSDTSGGAALNNSATLTVPAQLPFADSSTPVLQSDGHSGANNTPAARHIAKLAPQLAAELADSKQRMDAGPPNAIPIAIPEAQASTAASTSENGP